ncbi:hypothetical protein [Methylibium sp.]|uniref:hypothetical protein n=1 Tax=Methylibium sp. TaxID=2067992 RepID=UPI003BAA7171
MQYILSEQEYTALSRDKRSRSSAEKAELQKFCTLAAKHIPIVLKWSPSSPPKPWGCIKDTENPPGYCDCCPAQELCPNEHKEWSK